MWILKESIILSHRIEAELQELDDDTVPYAEQYDKIIHELKLGEVSTKSKPQTVKATETTAPSLVNIAKNSVNTPANTVNRTTDHRPTTVLDFSKLNINTSKSSSSKSNAPSNPSTNVERNDTKSANPDVASEGSQHGSLGTLDQSSKTTGIGNKSPDKGAKTAANYESNKPSNDTTGQTKSKASSQSSSDVKGPAKVNERVSVSDSDDELDFLLNLPNDIKVTGQQPVKQVTNAQSMKVGSVHSVDKSKDSTTKPPEAPRISEDVDMDILDALLS
ncbi:hypothetical protein M8J75_000533 [Diaphorina citri]|nr:hypothetical protein M8J75_000533 [Diaphorina citri]